MNEEEISMQIVNPRSAGIDIGSRSHWVAIGQGEKDYREFGVFNEDLYGISSWLKKVCDKEIEKFLNEIIDNDPDKKQHCIEEKPHKRVNKNAPKNIDLNLMSYQYFEGIDLMAIEGLSHLTVLSLMSEVGLDGIRRFPTAKHFVSWLRFAPKNKISGGKVLSSKVPKGSSRLKIALRRAANAIGNLKDSTPLSEFFKRINFRKGRVSAISATAQACRYNLEHGSKMHAI